MSEFHLAELNIARLRYDINDPRVADFVNNLNRVNAAAERSPGFVWRLVADADTSLAMTPDADPMVIPNLSVWTDVSSLENFVFKTVHKRIYDRRAEWFEVMDRMHFVMWRVAAGHKPTLEEALARLEHLNANGASDHAFGWDHVREANLWRSASCSGTAA
jgi:hypothetical protein